MSELFRKEAVDAQKQSLLGDAVLAQPLSLVLLTCFLASLVIIVSIFIALGSYARKETVSGYLSPDKGIAKIHASRNGVIGQLFIQEGQYVKQGTPLLTVKREEYTDIGLPIDGEMLKVIDRQMDEIAARRVLENRRHGAEKRQLLAELNGLESQQHAIDGQIRAQRELVRSLKENYDRVGDLIQRGYVSISQYMEREENLLTNEQLLSNLVQKMAVLLTHTRQTELRLESLPIESDERLSQLSSAESELSLKRLEFSGHNAITLNAPIAGKVTALQAIVGTSVDTRIPLLTILPEGGELQAYLFVPTRAVGFMQVGQEVRLLYDAFDYRRFGVHIGAISDISSTVFSPAEMQSNIQISEPMYRIKVLLKEQTVEAYGEVFSLQAGMDPGSNCQQSNKLE